VSWEAGQVSPSIWLLMELMEKFQIDPAWVIEGPGEAPVLRGEDGGKDRLTRLQAEVAKMATGLGLILPEGLKHQFALNIFKQTPEQEAEAKRDVRKILYEISMGKDD